MILWIAGWPHCGSTLTREYIQEVFGINSYSKYPEEELVFRFGPESLKFSESWSAEVYSQCRQSKKLFLIKTHEIPFDDSPAIYIQRDGRDAVVSLNKFWAHNTIQEIMTGQFSPFTDWSTYYKAWEPRTRTNTVYVQFDEIINSPEVVTKRIVDAFGLKQTGEFDSGKAFQEGQKQWPRLFSGKGETWQKELKGHALEMFWKLHGDVMRECGYAR